MPWRRKQAVDFICNRCFGCNGYSCLRFLGSAALRSSGVQVWSHLFSDFRRKTPDLQDSLDQRTRLLRIQDNNSSCALVVAVQDSGRPLTTNGSPGTWYKIIVPFNLYEDFLFGWGCVGAIVDHGSLCEHYNYCDVRYCPRL